MLASFVRVPLSFASPAGSRGRLSVLIFHRVLRSPDPLMPDEPSAEEFEALMRWVQRTFNVISLAEGVRGLNEGTLPERALCITFDDGYAEQRVDRGADPR